MFVFSYKGHGNAEYKIDSCLTHDDAHVVSGSEDGKICFWDLVEVKTLHYYIHTLPRNDWRKF